jgi:acetylornithine deacetylase/succinyl-diaminopimelate desuccinylase-like protein
MAMPSSTLRAGVVKVEDANPVEALARAPRVAKALEAIDRSLGWVTDQQIQLTEIPAPTFQEEKRGAAVRKILAANGLKTRIDSAGNIIGELSGSSRKDVVLVSAHLDTVFPAGTAVRVRKDGRNLAAPGISDNGAGLAALVGLARALHDAKLDTRMTVVFAANTGEEGEGNLRGMRKLVETYRGRLRAVIAIDGASTEHVTTMGLGSRRIEVTLSGPGGHSWADFGTPNPIHALARGVAQFLEVRVPDSPRTTYNVGVVEGGTSVNSIPDRATLKVDIRSESEAELERLESALRRAISDGIDAEMSAARDAGRSEAGRLDAKFKSLGVRPVGELPSDSPLLEAIRNADRFLGNRSHLERSSTDANIPLSLGIPAIAIGGGGRAGGAHSLAEWYDPTGRELGLKRILLAALTIAGLAE